jgi:uridine kinase
MRRTLNRPMFRRGGEVTTPKRGLVDGPGSYAGLQDVIPTAQDIEDYRANQPEAAPDRSTSDFLINFGLDLISRSPTGNIFQTAATSAKEPFKAMQAARYAQEGTERDEYNDMYKAIMTAKSDMLSSEGGSSTLARTQYAQAGEKLLDDLFNLQSQKDEMEVADFNLAQAKILQSLRVYSGEDPDLAALYGNKEYFEGVMDQITKNVKLSTNKITITNEQGQEEIVIEGEYAMENKGYLAEATKKRYLDMVKQDKINKRLGRSSKAEGGVMEETMTEEVAGPGGMAMASETIEEPITEPGSGLTYEELRQRLPAEITDDIIVILAESTAALVDFAEIQTQTDVDQFNMKYGVNLALPSGA